MNNVEAKAILDRELKHYRARPYSELLSLAETTETFERMSPSGVVYQVQVQVLFDDPSHRNLRVLAAIDDGGWRAFSPLSDDFIMNVNGTFIGE